MPVDQKVKEIQQFDWSRARVQPLGLHTGVQCPKVSKVPNVQRSQKYLHGNTFWHFWHQEFGLLARVGHMENGNPNFS